MEKSKMEAALEYAAKGWKVFPLTPNSKIPLKGSAGVKDATSDEKLIRAWWTTNPNANIALACGKVSKVYVIDVDVGHKAGVDGFATLKNKGIKIPFTLTQTTPSGGAHFLYSWAEGDEPANKINIMEGIDLRGTGSYIVVAPSSIDGKSYQWANEGTELAEFPEEVKPKVKASPWEGARTKGASVKTSVVSASDAYERARAYLAEVPGAVQGAGGHASLLWAAQCLVQGFGLSEEIATNLLWEEYNPKCVPPWNYASTADKKDFERKVREAKNHPLGKPQNWLLEESRAADAVTLDPNAAEDFVEYMLARAAKGSVETEPSESVNDSPRTEALDYDIKGEEVIEGARKAKAEDEIPRRLLEIPGIAGDIYKWINDTAGCPQPLLALGATLTFCGALMGQKVKDESGGRTNVYGLGVGHSSAGKDHALKAVIKIIQAAGIEDILGGEVTSDTAIERAIKTSPVKLFMMDEIGHFFRTINKARGNAPHLSTIVPTFMKLFSSASSLYVGKQKAGKEDSVVKIVEPCVCFWGVTSPQIFFDSMNEEELQGGWTARNLIFISRSRPKYRFPKEAQVPENISETCAAWARRVIKGDAEAEGNIAATIKPHQIVVKTDEAAKGEFEHFRDECYEKMLKADKSGDICNYLWGKSLENARRIALIYASSRDFDGATIDIKAAKYGTELVRFLTTRTIKEIHRAYAGNEYERAKKKIYDLIEKSKDEGLKHTTLVAKTPWIRDAKTRAGYLDELQEANRIKRVVLKAKTRPTIVYYATQWSPLEGDKPELYEED